MKQLFLIIITMLAVSTGVAQTIIKGEYYFDTDPGIGQGFDLDTEKINAGEEQMSIVTQELPAGEHTLCIRLQHSSGIWSPDQCRTFTVCNTPVASFERIVEGKNITLTNKSTHSTVYDWDFGDENTSVQKDPTHTYAEEGFYQVCLTVNNECDPSIKDTFCQEVMMGDFPTDVKVKAISSHEVEVSWTDNSSDEDGFIIERATNPDFEGEIFPFSVGPDIASFSDTALSPNTTYHYRVSKKKGDNPGVFYAVDAATTFIKLSAPTNLSAEAVSSNWITLTWEVSDTIQYSIERMSDPKVGYGPIDTVDTGISTFDDSLLSAETPYNYRIKALGKKNITDDSDYSDAANATTFLPTPTDLQAEANPSTSIELTWKSNATNDNGFVIERSPSPEANFNEISRVEKGKTEYTDTLLPPETIFYYRIKAMGNEIFPDSHYSDTVNATTLAPELIGIMPETNPNLITGEETKIKAKVDKPELVEGIAFNYRGLTDTQWQTKIPDHEGDGIFSSLLTKEMDEVGIEYYFKAFNAESDSVTTPHQFIYLRYEEDGIVFPTLNAGAKANDYNLISVPLKLDNTSILNTLNEMESYDIKKWRLFRVEKGAYQEYGTPGFTNIETGKGYFLAMADPHELHTGAGTTEVISDKNPFEMVLQQGWNMIGNPYNFDLSWNKIKAFNNTETISDFMVFRNGTYSESNLLEKFGGALVFSEKPDTLLIPVTKMLNSGGRLAQNHTSKNRLDHNQWEINFTLAVDTFQYGLGGFGMHPEAQKGKDKFDALAPPRFITYLETIFNHPEYFYPYFTKDIVPATDKHVWDFTVESNLHTAPKIMTWDNNFILPEEKILYLYHLEQNQFINMKTSAQYRFSDQGNAHFTIYFGPENELSMVLNQNLWSVGDPYPNPASASVTIPFLVAPPEKDFQVQLVIFDAMGRVISNINDYTFSKGYYQIIWDRTGNSVPQGLYFYRLELTTLTTKKIISGKILLN